VLAHPDFGVLTLEVKGGSVRYDARAGRWFTIGRQGEEPIKDPNAQARRASHLLGKALLRAKRGGGERISFGHAVVFPDTRVEARLLRPDLPREVVIDHRDLGRLDERLKDLFRYWFDRAEKAPLGQDGIALLESVLANAFELRAPLAYESAGMTVAQALPISQVCYVRAAIDSRRLTTCTTLDSPASTRSPSPPLPNCRFLYWVHDRHG